MQDDQIVYEFRKNAKEIARVEFNNYHGRDIIGIRVYYNVDEDKPEWRPTKKGISLSVGLLPELKKAVDRAYQVWQEQNIKNN